MHTFGYPAELSYTTRTGVVLEEVLTNNVKVVKGFQQAHKVEFVIFRKWHHKFVQLPDSDKGYQPTGQKRKVSDNTIDDGKLYNLIFALLESL